MGGRDQTQIFAATCGFLRLSCQVSLYPLAIRQELGGGMSRRTYFSSYSLGNGTRANLKGLHIRDGVRSRNRFIKAKGTVGHGAQQLPHGDSSDGNQRWPPRIETQRQACGKTIRCPFLSPTTNNLVSPNRKPQHQRGKGTRSDGEGGGTGDPTAPGPLLLPQINTHTVMCKTKKQKTKTFRKHPLGDLLSIICAG